MIQVSITKSGTISNQASFNSQEEADSWLSSHLGMGSFGSEAIYQDQQVLTSPEVRGPVDELVQAATFDAEGNEIEPALYSHNENGLISAAVYETQSVLAQAAEYSVEITDITAQINQEATNSAAEAYLISTDWYCTRFVDSAEAIPQNIKDARAAARLSIVR